MGTIYQYAFHLGELFSVSFLTPPVALIGGLIMRFAPGRRSWLRSIATCLAIWVILSNAVTIALVGMSLEAQRALSTGGYLVPGVVTELTYGLRVLFLLIDLVLLASLLSLFRNVRDAIFKKSAG